MFTGTSNNIFRPVSENRFKTMRRYDRTLFIIAGNAPPRNIAWSSACACDPRTEVLCYIVKTCEGRELGR